MSNLNWKAAAALATTCLIASGCGDSERPVHLMPLVAGGAPVEIDIPVTGYVEVTSNESAVERFPVTPDDPSRTAHKKAVARQAEIDTHQQKRYERTFLRGPDGSILTKKMPVFGGLDVDPTAWKSGGMAFFKNPVVNGEVCDDSTITTTLRQFHWAYEEHVDPVTKGKELITTFNGKPYGLVCHQGLLVAEVGYIVPSQNQILTAVEVPIALGKLGIGVGASAFGFRYAPDQTNISLQGGNNNNTGNGGTGIGNGGAGGTGEGGTVNGSGNSQVTQSNSQKTEQSNWQQQNNNMTQKTNVDASATANAASGHACQNSDCSRTTYNKDKGHGWTGMGPGGSW